MPKVVWTSENDRRLLIRLIERSAKAYDTVELSKLFQGATPKAIEERIAKLKREAKAAGGGGGSAAASSPAKGGKAGGKRKRSAAEAGGKKRKLSAKAAAMMEEEDDDDEEQGGKGRVKTEAESMSSDLLGDLDYEEDIKASPGASDEE